MHSGLPQGVYERLLAIVGQAGLISDPDELVPYLREQRGTYQGRSRLCILPSTTEQTAEVVRTLYEAQVAMVPQGGNTGLCGGAVAAESGDQVLINLRRMNRIRAIDADNFTLTAEAGCILADVQAAALAAERLFPLSLAAEGSCQIGGNLATNAGGTQVLRYGNARELVLGLEVVLPDGRILDTLRGLRKDNTGYDLRHLFCGAEGTLGIITAAVLKLFPRPREQVTAMLALPNLHAAIAVLTRARAETGDAITGCEFISRTALDMVLRHIPGTREPLRDRHDLYLLIEATSTASLPEAGDDDSRHGGKALQQACERLFEQCSDAGLIDDAAIAQNAGQRAEFWRLRESIPEAQKPEGVSLKHDVSVPVSRVADFVIEASARVQAALPGLRVCAFGHIGDGNIHFNLSQPVGVPGATFVAERERIAGIVHDLAVSMNGSFSAEHGIGRLKRDELRRYRSPVELSVMQSIKQALDPRGLMNPGKVL
jgi:FAD/FMN-containing dehydrogenase